MRAVFHIWARACCLPLSLAVLSLLGVPGCRLFRHEKTSVGQVEVFNLHEGHEKRSDLTMAGLQDQVMRFADQYGTVVATASDSFARRVGTPEARLAAVSWKREQGYW